MENEPLKEAKPSGAVKRAASTVFFNESGDEDNDLEVVMSGKGTLAAPSLPTKRARCET